VAGEYLDARNKVDPLSQISLFISIFLSTWNLSLSDLWSLVQWHKWAHLMELELENCSSMSDPQNNTTVSLSQCTKSKWHWFYVYSTATKSSDNTEVQLPYPMNISIIVQTNNFILLATGKVALKISMLVCLWGSSVSQL